MTSWQLTGFVEERELGSGGSGRVVLARHGATGNEVAIKYLAEWLSADAAHLAAFRSEAQLMAGLVDPHLVALYEYVETTAGAAIVMDLLEGVALRKILEDGGALTPEAALTLMKGSLLGLAALHAQGVVHRDYKPENVMVDAAGGTKLVDYGIAAPVGEIAGVSGTPLYMAPEQWRGEPSNAATDVYAATATFVECLTGRPMFTGTTVGALLHQHLTIPPPLDDLPEAVRPIAAAGLAKDPAERIGDASALVAQLDVLAPAAYGPEWETHGRAHLAARAALLALLFAHPERVAHEQAFARDRPRQCRIGLGRRPAPEARGRRAADAAAGRPLGGRGAPAPPAPADPGTRRPRHRDHGAGPGPPCGEQPAVVQRGVRAAPADRRRPRPERFDADAEPPRPHRHPHRRRARRLRSPPPTQRPADVHHPADRDADPAGPDLDRTNDPGAQDLADTVAGQGPDQGPADHVPAAEPDQQPAREVALPPRRRSRRRSSTARPPRRSADGSR